MRNLKDCSDAERVMVCDHKSLYKINCKWMCKPKG
jgi:hypothetical protein